MLYPTGHVRRPRPPEPEIEQEDEVDFLEVPAPVAAALDLLGHFRHH
jgi:hypothetical protein